MHFTTVVYIDFIKTSEEMQTHLLLCVLPIFLCGSSTALVYITKLKKLYRFT